MDGHKLILLLITVHIYIINANYSIIKRTDPLKYIITYLLRSHIFEVLSMEQDATKSPPVCHEQPHTAWVWSENVVTHSALEKSQILIVPSPDEVARRAPLSKRGNMNMIIYNNQVQHLFIHFVVFTSMKGLKVHPGTAAVELTPTEQQREGHFVLLVVFSGEEKLSFSVLTLDGSHNQRSSLYDLHQS